MLIDTHCHLDDERFGEDRKEVISSLGENGISRAITIGCDRETSLKCVSIADEYENIFCAVGTHPHYADGFTDDDLDLYASLSKDEKVVAIGEIGLDYFYDFSPREKQKEVFVRQLHLASSLSLPVIIHLRDAYEDMTSLLDDNRSLLKNGIVFHCYSGSKETASIYSKYDAYFSFGGAITFKNAKAIYEVLPSIPSDRILFETDSPYLTPVPYRGQRNEPKYTNLVVDKAAEILHTDAEKLKEISTKNAFELFKKLK